MSKGLQKRAATPRRRKSKEKGMDLPETPEILARYEWELMADLTRFEQPGWIEGLPECVGLNPGLADIQIAFVGQVGHRDKFPRP